ncbi:interleukin-22 [Rhineura floridana]|uniref:interleukin-22 n=1 Tax=Rhineura floridana TaxID=261503 RepID=UPI002AC7F0FC|nr:interleukin-22 [Rhineura floridana]
MNQVQKWMRFFLVWMFCCCCLPLLFFASPLPLKEADNLTNHFCKLSRNDFQSTYIKNRTYTLAKQGRCFDKDTENRFVGQPLYMNIKENDRCYLMKRVTDIVLTDVLSELKNKYPSVQEVATFLAHLNMKLSGCKPLGDKEHIESNLKQMKDKLDQLGENGKNKAVGELDLLFDYLENACTEVPKNPGSSQKGSKN